MPEHEQMDLIPKEQTTEDPQLRAERESARQRLGEFLKDPEFRSIEGFPIGDDEAILALSDPPYYTACPNPFIHEIVGEWQKERAELHAKLGLKDDEYQREPFAADVSEGKNDPIYNAHSYHTKVPHKAIMRYILHYTDPGDIVYDGFCGTGMTGVAAQLSGDKKAVEELGYRVDQMGVIWDGDKSISRLGVRKAILNDLSPVATFIAYNYNNPVDTVSFEREAKRILKELEQECGWMYETWHPHCDDPRRIKARINYTVWSEVFICPHCSREIVFLEQALDEDTKRVKESFACPHCGAEASKRSLDKCRITVLDLATQSTRETLKRVPTIIEYSIGKKKYSKHVDRSDLELVDKIQALPFPEGFVHEKLPYMHMTHQRAHMANYGVTHMHHFYFPRAQQVVSSLWRKAGSTSDKRLRAFMFFMIEQTLWGMAILNRYGPTHFSQVNRYLSGVFYISSLISEVSPWYILDGKLSRLIKAFSGLRENVGQTVISTYSSTATSFFDNFIDYIFTDPPFGENIYYADLNYMVESWHGVRTNSGPEAIIDQAKQKGMPDYQELMRQVFARYYQSLKPGHWMTVEFHNSHNAVWNAIQQALMEVGFVVADVRTLDKQSSSYRQVTAASAAKQDLVISAYKPNGDLEEKFQLKAGSEEGVWEFILYHLSKLPVVVEINGKIEAIAERQPFLLFDRMVAFHIQHQTTVPLSASQFYAGIRNRFPIRDGMVFLPDQTPIYDSARLRIGQLVQLSLLVTDEKTAINWLRQQLDPTMGGEPQTYQEIQPKFLKQLQQADHEMFPDLHELLEQNFLLGETDHWYLPDLNRASDIEKIRVRELLKEFNEYVSTSGRLRKFRTEAVRAGFLEALRRQDYDMIIKVSDRLPENVLREDPDLLMYYDSAMLRKK